MNKIIVIVLCIFSLVAHAAESDKTAMCLAGNTLFLVSKNDICRHNGTLDVMVIGKREQDRFKNPMSKEEHNIIGTVFCVQDKTVYVLPKTAKSSSSDESYTLSVRDSQLCKKAQAEEAGCDLMYVIEPVIGLKDLGKHRPRTYSYCPYRAGVENPHDATYHSFLRDSALEQAGDDIIICYQNALLKGLELVKNKENKSIGLATLSTERGFPRERAIPITFKAITDFLEGHDGYSFVHLFVRKRFELKKYKELMGKYNEKYRK